MPLGVHFCWPPCVNPIRRLIRQVPSYGQRESGLQRTRCALIRATGGSNAEWGEIVKTCDKM
jgi:hypothetical protein